MAVLHANNDDEPKYCVGNTCYRPEYSLDEKHIVRHRRRPLARRGTRPPGRRLPQPTTPQERDGEGDQLRHAPRREPGFRQSRRQPAERTRDARKQYGGPRPNCARHVLGIPSPVGRGPYTGLWRVGHLPWCVSSLVWRGSIDRALTLYNRSG